MRKFTVVRGHAGSGKTTFAKEKIKEFKNRLINNISKNDMKKDKYTIFMDIIKKILINL